MTMMLKRLLFSLILVSFISLPQRVFAATPSPVTTTPTSTVQTPANTKNGTPDLLINPVQGPSVTHLLATRARSSWPWYITRAAGLMAAVFLVMLILSGVGLITGYTFRLLEPLTAWATHRAIGIAFAVSGVIHVVALLFDTYVPFTVAQALVPFLSSYRPVTIAGHHLGSLYVALGILAMYAVLTMVITSYLWVDKKPHTWKFFHFLGYMVMVFVFFHALFLGTDFIAGPLRTIWIVFGVAMGLAFLYRLRLRKANR